MATEEHTPRHARALDKLIDVCEQLWASPEEWARDLADDLHSAMLASKRSIMAHYVGKNVAFIEDARARREEGKA